MIGSQLRATASRLDAIGAEWDRRLAAISEIAEGLRGVVTSTPAATGRHEYRCPDTESDTTLVPPVARREGQA